MNGAAPRRTALARALLACLAAALALLILESGARIVERVRVRDAARATDERIPDALLEYRVAPGSGEHDARGYRNREALERAEVVALGDSQTFGVNATEGESWPAELARETGLRVYNMGHGGYGPLQYVALLEEALALAPRFVVVALYLGNDLFDAYDLAYRLDAHARFRHPDPDEQARIAAAEYPDLQRMFFQRVNYHRPGIEPLAWLLANTAAGRLAAGATRARSLDADSLWAEDHPEEGFVYDAGGVHTVFHTTYRLAAVDTRLPQIREGLRITGAALAEMQHTLEAQRAERTEGAQLLVVLLPTKERIFAEAVRRAGVDAPPTYDECVRRETEVTRALERELAASGIASIDALPALEAGVLAGEELFPRNGDGHFTAHGYSRIAQLVASAIASHTTR